MKALVILDSAVLALMATIAVVLGVVCLMYAVYAENSSKVSAELPLLLLSTAVFAGLSLVWGAALIGALRRRRWLWPAQGGAVVALLVAALVLYSRYS